MENTYSGIAGFLAQTDAVGIAVFVLLVLMSAASWTVIVMKAWRYSASRRQSARLMQGFWEASSFQQAVHRLEGAGPDDPFARLALAAERAIAHQQRQGQKVLGETTEVSEFVTRQLRNAINRANARLEWGLTMLASVGSTAPFIGLFGTVWGIYHALIGISRSGQASLEKVAGPVGEALIMTGLGLAVAIPAVLGYNAFTRRNRVILAELDGFAHDLHAWVVTGARLEAQQATRPMLRPSAQPSPKGAS
jgi:biopolymer transport protein ExbB